MFASMFSGIAFVTLLTSSTVTYAQSIVVPYWTLHISAGTGHFLPGHSLIQNKSDFERVWREIYSGRIPVPLPPTIDFSKELIVLLTMGMKSSGGYSITGGDAYYDGQAIVISYHTFSPGAGCIVQAAITAPAILIRLENNGRPLKFENHAQVKACVHPPKTLQ